MSFFKNLSAELGTATGKGIVGLVKILGVIFWKGVVWLFDWQHKGKEPEPKTNSFRMAAWSIILSVIFMPGLVTCSGTGNQTQVNQDNNKIVVTIQLQKGEDPVIPNDEHFKSLPHSEAYSYIVINNKKYFRYSESDEVNTEPATMVTESSCFIVPAGRALKIYTAYRPLVAINMETTLLRQVKKETVSYISRFFLFIREFLSGKSLLAVSEDSWLQTFYFWNDSFTTDGNMTAIMVKAKSNKDIPGGLVCF